MKSLTGDNARLSHHPTLLEELAFAMEDRFSPSRSSARKRDESNDLNDSTSRARPKIRSRASTDELRVVAINCNPAPDAQDRLRRLFTLLLEHAARERQAAPDEDSPADSLPAADRAEAEA